jgi:multiple sugar transport system substrate-binding protein
MATRLSRREFLVGSSVAAASGLLAGCAKEAEPTPEEKEAPTQEPVEEAPAEEAIELQLMMVAYTDETQTVLEEELLPEFSEQNGGSTVTVNYTDWGRYNEEITTAFASGVTPDVFQGGAVWSPQMARRGWALALNDYIAAAGEWDWDDFFEAVQEDVTINGTIVGVPYQIGIRSLWHRTDHLEAAGFSDPPTNWEELEEIAVACTKRDDGQITQEGFHFSGAGGNWQSDLQPYMIFMEQAGGTYLSDDLTRCTLSDPPAVEALEFVRKLIVDLEVQPYPGFEPRGDIDPFVFGLSSMTYGNVGIERNARVHAPDELDNLQVTLPPKGSVRATHVWVDKFFVSDLTKTPDLSWGLLKHLTAPVAMGKVCASFGANPPRGSLKDSEFMTDRMRVLLECAEYAIAYPKYWRLIEIFRPLANGLEKCLRGELTAQETMDEVCTAVDAILAEDQE